MSKADWKSHGVLLAAPVSGSAIVLSILELAVVLGLETEDPVGYILQGLERHDLKLKPVGTDQWVEGEEAKRKAVHHLIESVGTQKLPLLFALGIVEPV